MLVAGQARDYKILTWGRDMGGPVKPNIQRDEKESES